MWNEDMNSEQLIAWQRLDHAISTILVAQPNRMTEAADELKVAQQNMYKCVMDQLLQTIG